MSDYFIGLTGGIASGKSALEKAFAAHGIVVADADLLAREVVQPGTPALAAVVERFGRGVLLADGQLDRAALRERVFGNDGERRALEAILHPAIRARLQEICRNATSPYAIAVIPLLTGMIADATGSLALAFILPAACYAVIAGFGWYARQPA